MNTNKIRASILAFAMTAAGLAAFGDTYAWDASATPATLGGGTTDGGTLTYAGGKVATFYAYPTTEAIEMTGDEMTFANGATVGLAANGSLTFSNALASLGSLTFAFGSPEPAKWDGNGTLLKKSEDIIVFAGLSLAACSVRSCVYNKTNVSGNNVKQGLEGAPYFAVRGTDADGRDTLAVQMQCQDGWNIKCVKVLLTQVGGDIGARILWCRNISRDYPHAVLGLDFESGAEGIQERQVTCENPYPGATAFDVEVLALDVALDDGLVTIASAVAAPSGVTVSTGAKVVADGAGALTVNGTSPLAWTVNGELGVKNVGTLDMTGAIAGDGALVVGPSTESDLAVKVSGANTMSLNGRIRVYGSAEHPTTFTVNNTAGLPASGQIDVYDGATLDLAVSASAFSGVQEGYCDIAVHEGGELRATPNGIGGGRQKVALMGASAEIYGAGWSAGYPNNMTFADGSTLKRTRTTGTGVLSLGYVGSATWSVRGAGLSKVTSAVEMLGGSNGTHYDFVLDVADTTGDAEADFVFEKDLTYSTTYAQCGFRKTGAGTVRLNGAFSCNPAFPLSVEGGLWQLGASSVMNGTDHVVLSGGGLAAVAGTSNGMGTLALSGDGSIVLEAGATLQVADSSAVAWADGAMLSVTAAEGSSIAFGSSAAGLTSAQLSRIKMNGHKVVIGEDGTLKEYVPGLILLLR